MLEPQGDVVRMTRLGPSGISRLLASLVIIVVAIATSFYLSYPSVAQVASEVRVGSLTSTFTYTSVLTSTITSTTKSCSREEKQQSCSYSTSRLQSTVQVLRTEYTSMIHSSTTYQNHTVPPYTALRLSLTQFALVTIVELMGVIGVAALILKPRKEAPGAKHRIEQARPAVVPRVMTRQTTTQLRLNRKVIGIILILIAFLVLFFGPPGWIIAFFLFIIGLITIVGRRVRCYRCHGTIDRSTASRCGRCKWHICPACGACGCHYKGTRRFR